MTECDNQDQETVRAMIQNTTTSSKVNKVSDNNIYITLSSPTIDTNLLISRDNIMA